jgi:hypothetical protein
MVDFISFTPTPHNCQTAYVLDSGIVIPLI